MSLHDTDLRVARTRFEGVTGCEGSESLRGSARVLAAALVVVDDTIRTAFWGVSPSCLAALDLSHAPGSEYTPNSG